MKLVLGYPYGELCGIAKIGVEFGSADEKRLNLTLVANGIAKPLGLSGEYLDTHSVVHFGLNTYKVTQQPIQILDLELLSERGCEDRVRMVSANDPALWSAILEPMRKLPMLMPMPLDSRQFAGLDVQEFPTRFPPSFQEEGVFVMNDIFTEAEVDAAAAHLDAACAAGFGGYEEGSSARVRHLHLQNGGIAHIFRHRGLRRRLQEIYGVEMIPCQTLSYRYGSQQGPHSDFVHLTAYPQNLMCGVWIALEDVREGAGELSYFIGSQKEPRLTVHDFGMKKIQNDDYSSFIDTFDASWRSIAGRYQERRGLLKKGEVLIWDGNLIHAGNPRLDPTLTRKSVVLHFFAKGAVCYYDATGDIGFASELRPA